MANIQDLYSLKEQTKHRFFEAFKDIIQQNGTSNSFILVADSYQLSLISPVLKMSDLLSHGISIIEKLELKRKPFPKQHAIYLLSPVQTSIELLLEDFKDDKEYLYKRVHIFFSTKLTNKKLFQQIAANKVLMKRMLTCKEFNHDFYFGGENLFTLRMNESIQTLFSFQNNIEYQAMVENIPSKLLTVVSSLGPLHTLNIIYRKESKLCEKISSEFQQELKLYFEKQENQQDEGSKSILNYESADTHFIILDRSIDISTTMAHDFFYESLVYDLLEVHDDQIQFEHRIKNQENKDETVVKKVNLSQCDDRVWKKYRYEHIGDALDGIPKELKQFVDTNNAARLAQKQGGEDISSIMSQLPSYGEFLQQFAMNINLSDACSNKIEEYNLKDIGELEQQLMTGIQANGKQTSSSKLVQDFIDLCLNKKFKQDSDRLRLAALLFINLELSQKEAQQILKQIPKDQRKVLYNLEKLGNKPQNPNNSEKTTKRVDTSIRRYAKKLLKSQKLDLARHTPYTKLVLESILNEIFNLTPKTETEQNAQTGLEKYNLAQLVLNEKPQSNQETSKQRDQGKAKSWGNSPKSNPEKEKLLSKSAINKKGENKPKKDKKNNNEDDDNDDDDEEEEENNKERKSDFKQFMNQQILQRNESSNNIDMNLKIPKVILFFVGGITHAEIRILSSLQQSYRHPFFLILGSTQILTPKDFLFSLECMHNSQVEKQNVDKE